MKKILCPCQSHLTPFFSLFCRIRVELKSYIFFFCVLRIIHSKIGMKKILQSNIGISIMLTAPLCEGAIRNFYYTLVRKLKSYGNNCSYLLFMW